MEQKYNSIKATKEFCFSQIKVAEATLKELREQCDHPETELCTYSTRPGQYWENTEICSICGDVIKIPGMDWIGEDRHNNDPEKCDDCGNSVYNCKCDPC